MLGMQRTIGVKLLTGTLSLKEHIRYAFDEFYQHIHVEETLYRSSLLSQGIPSGVRSADPSNPLEKIQLLLDDV